MPSPILVMADAVVAVLNDEDSDWSQEFEAERIYDPSTPLEATVDLQVMVAVARRVRTPLTRTDTDIDHEIHIGVIKKVTSQADSDALVEFVDEIEAEFEEGMSIGGGTVMQIETILYDLASMMQYKAFFSVVKLTIKQD